MVVASMAMLLRNTFLLKRSLSQPQLLTGFNRETLGTSQNLNFSTTGRKLSKSNESDSREENVSKKVFALQRAMDHINSAFGKGSIMWLGRYVSPNNLTVVSTGSFALNVPLGIGGLPKGFKQGTLGTSQKLSFSTKGRRRSKSDGSDSCEENISKKDMALQQAMDQITSAFGKGSIMWLGRSVSPKNVPVVSTGSFALDIALGVGGLPKGRVVEIFGPEASGKTTLALHVIAEAQKLGGYCAFVDAEHALDKALAESIGVNTENVLLSQPDCGEQALSLVDTLIRSGSLDVIVVDSVAALVPKGELDGEMGDAHMAMQARLMSQALRKLCHSLSLSQCILIFINQVRSKLSTFGGFGGPTEVTCGGNALKFYASVRLNIKRIGLVKKGEETLGSQVLVKVVKNKLAPPFKTAQFELEFGKGICREAEIIELSLKHKLISKHGSFYQYNGQNFHGKDALKKFLAQGDGAQELTIKLREKLLSSETEMVPEAQVLSTVDVTEEMVSHDSTDEEAAAAVEA